ncbi:MAG: MFS transporter [Nitrospiria bacterium]
MANFSKLFKQSLIRPGDLNAFFGLMLDNVTQLILMSGILIGIFGYPKEIVFSKMIPGSVMGVLFGDLTFAYMAVRLAGKTGRTDITAMPLGIDTPSLFAFTFGIIGPAFLLLHDAILAWKVSAAVIVLVGLFKTAFSFAGERIRNWVPRAGLLGPIGAIAVSLIAFFPTLKVFHQPLVGFLSLTIILTTIVAKTRFAFNLPGAFAAVLTGTGLYYLLVLYGYYPETASSYGNFWSISIPFPTAGFVEGIPSAISYIPLAVPFALMVLIGGIDVTESASASGDDYPATKVLLTDGISTLFSGLCGGVVQTTPYIGHPAYKGMGAGAGYTLGTAIFIGLGGILGYLGFIVNLIPETAVAPILIFIGLEITAQSYLVTPIRHYKAMAIASAPILATLILIEVNSILGGAGINAESLKGDSAVSYHMLLVLSNGFIITSLIWSSALSYIIDLKFEKGAAFLFAAGILSLFGIIHSPFYNGKVFLPWVSVSPLSVQISAAYFLSALFLLGVKGSAKFASTGK